MMNKEKFFIEAMKAGNYKKLQWIITAFSLTRPLEGIKDKEYKYKIRVNLEQKTYEYINPEDGSIVSFKGIDSSKDPLFSFRETIKINPGDIPNLKEPVQTTYGRLLFNWLVLVEVFGTKIDYQNSSIDLKKIEAFIVSKLEDNPKQDQGEQSDKIYVREYLKYTGSVYFLTGLSQLCVQGATEKVLLPPPGLKEFKEKLLKENKDSLDNMATVAKIDAALIDYDAQYLKGDPGEDFLISSKSRNVVRKKSFLMLGSEIGLDDSNIGASLISNSLNEGWDINGFPEMINSLRAGSFNRGAQTELGGVAVKWLLRASSNMLITKDDCGSKLGSPFEVTEDNKNNLVGFSIIEKGVSKPIDTTEQANTYIGKKVILRNPMYCKLDKTDYCKVCVGKRLSVNPTGLSIAVSDYGATFLSIFMKASHGTELELAKLDVQNSIQ